MSAPPIPLEGERSEMKPNFFIYTADIEVDGVKQKKYSLWNATEDTQFRATFGFGEPEVLVPLHPDVQKKDDTTFILSLYPGEAKEFVRGRFKSSKRGLAFGPPDKAWQEKKAAEQTAEVEVHTLAVRAALKANPSKDGRYTADYISTVCIKEGIPFVDLTFPPKTTSLFRDFEENGCAFKNKVLPWKRPADYCPKGKTPALYVGTIEPADIDQGEALGNCYWCTALACAAEFPKIIIGLMNVPREPELGVYRVRLCKNGWWQTITLDDLLPVKGELPIFAKNREEPNELWVSLYEKAFAKIHGSYQSLVKGDAALTIADFFGVPYIKLKDLKYWDDKPKVFDYLVKCDGESACMTAGTPGIDPKSAGGKMTAEQQALSDKYKAAGLVTGHAFSLLSAKEWNGHRLVQIRNPWAGVEGSEWTGKYSDDDPCWKDPEMAKAFNFTKADDGSFWMPYDEMWNFFESASVSHLKCLTKYSSVRVAGNFDKGIPDVVLKVTVGGGKPVSVFTGLHQKDQRGLRPQDKDGKYVGSMISIVKQGADGKCTVVEKSGDAYMIARDIFIYDCVLPPAPPSEPYFIIPQCYSEDDKSFVHSLFLEHTDGISVEFVGYKEGLGKKINNAALFSPTNCSQKVAAQIQYQTPEMNGDWCEGEQNAVDFSQAMKALAGKPKIAGRLSNDVDVKRVEAAQAKAAKLGAAAAAAGQASGNLCISVTCISGHGLRSMDANGLADPYLVIAVRDKDGKTRGDIEAQSTKYIPKTLDPTWGEVFKFEGLAPDNQFYVQCYDKDLVEGDDAIGTCVVPIASLGLKKGGGGKVADYELEKGGGKVKLMFSM